MRVDLLRRNCRIPLGKRAQVGLYSRRHRGVGSASSDWQARRKGETDYVAHVLSVKLSHFLRPRCHSHGGIGMLYMDASEF